MKVELWKIKGTDKDLVKISSLKDLNLSMEDFNKEGEYKDSKYLYRLKSNKEALLDKILYSKTSIFILGLYYEEVIINPISKYFFTNSYFEFINICRK